MYSRAIWAFAIGKIALASLMQLPSYCSCNYSQIALESMRLPIHSKAITSYALAVTGCHSAEWCRALPCSECTGELGKSRRLLFHKV